MLRAIRATLLLGLLLGVLAQAAPAAAQRQSYRAERFDVDVRVEEGGTLLVTETIIFEFAGQPFTYAFRELLPARSGGFRDIEAYLDGVRLPVGTEAGQVEIDDGDPLRVTWHFAPMLGRHTFELRYRQLDVVQRTEAGDLLRYQPLPDEFEYDIDASRVTISYPAMAQPVNAATIVEGRGTLTSAPGQIEISAQNIRSDRTLIVEQTFTAGSLISAPPAWQQARAARNALGPWWGVAALLLSAVAIGVPLAWRPRTSVPTLTGERFTPPDDLPPALAGALNGSEPVWANALATLFDLAQREVVAIVELPRKRWQGQDFEIQLLQQPADLRPHEAALFAMLFEDKHGARRAAVRFSELGALVGSRSWKVFSESVKDELQAVGLWDNTRLRPRGRLYVFGALALLLAFVVFVATIVALEARYGGWPALLSLPLFIGGLTAFVVAGLYKPLTAQGAQRAADWQAFYQFLRGVTRGRNAVSSPDMFDRYLTYATSYGLLTSWVKHFEKTGWQTPPAWFQALPDGDTSSIAIFAAMANSANSSGVAATGGAAGGAAGGGSSGAG